MCLAEALLESVSLSVGPLNVVTRPRLWLKTTSEKGPHLSCVVFTDLPQDEQTVQLEETCARATLAITKARALCLIMGSLGPPWSGYSDGLLST